MSKFRKFQQNKLWRDKLPAKMEVMGSIIHVKHLNDEDFNKELLTKLLEEANEVKEAKTKQELLGELADVFEVIDSLCSLHNFARQDIENAQTKKRIERGGFQERKFVTFAEHQEGSFGEQYCLAQPEKYPEMD